MGINLGEATHHHNRWTNLYFLRFPSSNQEAIEIVSSRRLSCDAPAASERPETDQNLGELKHFRTPQPHTVDQEAIEEYNPTYVGRS